MSCVGTPTKSSFVTSTARYLLPRRPERVWCGSTPPGPLPPPNTRPEGFEASRSLRSAASSSSRAFIFSACAAASGGTGFLANAAFHLKLDQAVHLDGVLQRQFLRDR